ncbi:hypothetical protein [uncultured Sulfitobacter sp.]|uniref:hypothetical protein n=1 Tax=uncultured Sulfitobacter sp. TaxID=191468 RepID=UPI0026299712|nr:hypothetical protein [uncultured Sulfitobacter sp.]
MKYKIEPNGLISDEDGNITAAQRDGFIVGSALWPTMPYIILRLYRQTEHAQGRESSHTDEIPANLIDQFVLTSDNARKIAREILRKADQADRDLQTVLKRGPS